MQRLIQTQNLTESATFYRQSILEYSHGYRLGIPTSVRVTVDSLLISNVTSDHCVTDMRRLARSEMLKTTTVLGQGEAIGQDLEPSPKTSNGRP